MVSLLITNLDLPGTHFKFSFLAKVTIGIHASLLLHVCQFSLNNLCDIILINNRTVALQAIPMLLSFLCAFGLPVQHGKA